MTRNKLNELMDRATEAETRERAAILSPKELRDLCEAARIGLRTVENLRIASLSVITMHPQLHR